MLGREVVGTRFSRGGIRICRKNAQLTGEANTVVCARDGGVRCGDARLEFANQCRSSFDELRAERDEFVIPDIESRKLFRASRTRRLEQRVALANNPVIIRNDTAEPR